MSNYKNFLDYISSKEWRYPQYIYNAFASPNALSMIAFCEDGVVKKTQGMIENGKIISQKVEKYPSVGGSTTGGLNVSYNPFSENIYTVSFDGLTLLFSQGGQMKIYSKPGETLSCVGANSIGPTNNITMNNFVLFSPLFDPTMQNTAFRSVSLWVIFVVLFILFIMAAAHVVVRLFMPY